MKPGLVPGLSHSFEFEVPWTKTVPLLYPEAPEFQQMPEVLATGFLVGLLEWACVRTVNPFLDWPRELTVGTGIDATHAAATPPGMRVTVSARLLEVDGRRLVFDVEAHDGVDGISRGRHERHVVDRARFDSKVAAKASGSAVDRNGSSGLDAAARRSPHDAAAGSPFRVREIDHVVLRVSDLPAMQRFYREVLGCPVARVRDDLGMVHLRAGRSLIDLVDVAGPLGRRGGGVPVNDGRNVDHVCLRVHPFDEHAIRAHLAGLGVSAEEARRRFGADGEGPSLYLRDPEGNTVELKGPPDPATS